METVGVGSPAYYERVPKGTNLNGGLLLVTILQAEEVEGKYHTNPFVEVHFHGGKKKTMVSIILGCSISLFGIKFLHCKHVPHDVSSLHTS